MKVLIIPDVHLKPQMFDRAKEIMAEYHPDNVVCLMDIADDWNQQWNLDLYVETYNAAIHFAESFPDSLWCYGNHDLSYIWQEKESGYSPIAVKTVIERLKALQESLPDKKQVTYVHRIDNVLFSHGGVSKTFVKERVPDAENLSIDEVLEQINHFGRKQMWTELSPIWLRPQGSFRHLYKENELFQVVGHTPMKEITREKNFLSCDNFSTNRNRERVSAWEYPLFDTETWEWQGIPFEERENE